MKSFYLFFFQFEKFINRNAHCSYFNFQSSASSLNLPMKFIHLFFSNVFNNYDFITMCNENHIINPSSHMLQKFHWRKKWNFSTNKIVVSGNKSVLYVMIFLFLLVLLHVFHTILSEIWKKNEAKICMSILHKGFQT